MSTMATVISSALLTFRAKKSIINVTEIYKDMPQLLKEALEWFEKNWKK